MGRLRRLAEPAGRAAATRATTRPSPGVRRFKQRQGKRAPAPIKACPWCGTAFTPDSLPLRAEHAGRRATSRSAAPTPTCDFTRDRALPVLTVDEPIYRRLPAFLIATVDKFAGLPWVGESGAFFGHVDRYDRARLLRRGRAGRGPAARQRPRARSAGSDHPGRAAPDLRAARHRRRPLRDRDRSRCRSAQDRRERRAAQDRRLDRDGAARRRRRSGRCSTATETADLPAARHRPRATASSRGRVPSAPEPGAALSRRRRPGPRPEARLPARADDAARGSRRPNAHGGRCARPTRPTPT